MADAVAVIVFGFIGLTVLAVVLYIGGMLLTGPAILADSAVKAVKAHEHEHAPRMHHQGRLALHH